MSRTYELYVGCSTHDLLRRHVTVAWWRYVQVVASDVVEAQLIACQLVASARQVMPTDVMWSDDERLDQRS